MIEKLNQPGKVIFSECEIIRNNSGLNIIPQVDEIIIYEDLYSPYISGVVKVRDTLDLPNAFGKFALDVLKLKIYTPEIGAESYIDQFFVIYKISEKTAVKDRTQTYLLHFVSIEMVEDISLNLSKKLSGSGSDILTTLFGTYFKTKKKLNFDKASNNISYVSNFWSGSKNISYVLDQSIGPNNSPTFVFYENRDGFNFKTIESLISSDNKVFQKFNSTNYSGTTGEAGTVNASHVVRDLGIEYSNINGIRIDTSFDIFKDYLDGSLISKLYSNDPITKQIRWGTFSRSTLTARMNRESFYSDDTLSLFRPIVGKIDRGYGTFGINEFSNYANVQRRNAVVRMLQASKIEIDVYGRTDYTVGIKVDVNLNRLKLIEQSDSASDVIDKHFSGNYIITAISHQITRDGGHKCTLELSKESTIKNE